MSPFKILGLDGRADAVQVKRAYAGLLRQHRPDEDPEGFQRIHEAYEACLEQLRWREQGWDDDSEDETLERGEEPAVQFASVDALDDASFVVVNAGATASGAADAANESIIGESEEGFDSAAFAEELAQRMRTDTPSGVETWLQAHPDLYSLERKHALQYPVVAALEMVEPTAAAPHFESVTTFFGLDSISGVDSQLRHRLYEVQRRFGDIEEFKRVLRTQAGPYATWTDRKIADELVQPFSWLRRLCLIAFPGLPNRTGNFARALHAADPDAASTDINQSAQRFWNRATDRNALHRERFALIATRLLLWTAVIGAYVVAIDEGRGFALNWAMGFGGSFLLWLAYALVVLGLIRFHDYNQARMQWDWLLLLTAIGLGCGVALVAMDLSGSIPFIVTTIFWLGSRHPGGEGWSQSQVAALLTGISACGLVLLTLDKLVGDGLALRYQICAAVLSAFAMLTIHDILLSRVRGLSLPVARTQTGWLWPLFGAQLVLLFVVSFTL
ncbi:J domain-containing protein [Arenimonas sp.]|uniref:J domain-containing protein n=1 Tax=Arenimonas sp. TaxID=1872635 RepID=UPI0039E607D2